VLGVSGVDYEAVRAQASLAEVLELLGFVASETSGDESSGDQARGACPLHESPSRDSRSFSANLSKNIYRCFRCGAAGNQLDLWMAATKQPLYRTAIDLFDRFLQTRLDRPIPRLPR
jgi:DNA primase